MSRAFFRPFSYERFNLNCRLTLRRFREVRLEMLDCKRRNKLICTQFAYDTLEQRQLLTTFYVDAATGSETNVGTEPFGKPHSVL